MKLEVPTNFTTESESDTSLAPRTSDHRRQYFLHNAANLRPIPWNSGAQLFDAEKSAIANSLREFQLGESSEGKHLILQGKRYAQRSGDATDPIALALFIAEENRHAADLGRFLDLAGIERARRAWSDVVFRWLRHRAGLVLSITVLVTAEIIAQVYYPALRDATTSPILRALCQQIIADEEAHVRFQAERLAILRARKSRVALLLRNVFAPTLFAGACVVVWIQHRKVFRAAGGNIATFWRSAWRHYSAATRRAQPARIKPPLTFPLKVGHPQAEG